MPYFVKFLPQPTFTRVNNICNLNVQNEGESRGVNGFLNNEKTAELVPRGFPKLKLDQGALGMSDP